MIKTSPATPWPHSTTKSTSRGVVMTFPLSLGQIRSSREVAVALAEELVLEAVELEAAVPVVVLLPRRDSTVAKVIPGAEVRLFDSIEL